MTSIYLSASKRWTPTSEADIQAALDQGLIGESHHLDLKEFPAGKGDNKEAARDMASFAIDGGALIYGIAEDKENRSFYRKPGPLNGMAEKLEQVARSLCDPPLTLTTEEIPSACDPTQGYVIVHIPASSTAPHMVDGRYYGRGDKTKHPLPDPEVVRLHERRRAADRDALALLQAEIDTDPIPAEIRRQAHLFLVAQPLAGREDMLLDLVSGPNWNLDMGGFLNQAFTSEVNTAVKGIDGKPSLSDAHRGFRRAGGAARATPNLGDGRVFDPSVSYHAEDAVELRVHEDGGLRVFMSRFSDTWPNGEEQIILDQAAVSYTRRFLALVLAAAERAGYFGNWALAFGATGLRGHHANNQGNILGFEDLARYDQDDYRRATAATWAELNQMPGTITRALIGALLRALGTEGRYTDILTSPEATTEA